MGLFAAAAAFGKLAAGYPYPTIKTGGELVTADNLKVVGDRTAIWLDKAKKYGFV